MTNPHLPILDEATESLAPPIRERIWSRLRALRGAGRSILVIDKYVQKLVALADHHTIIERGNSQELGAQPDFWHRYIGV